MKVLLVDDEAVTRDTLRAIMTAQGHDVVAAAGGVEAWGQWQLAGYRVVVADWIMPELDGLELCRRIRAYQGRPYTYFLLQTIRSGTESFLQAMAAGVDDFISKPIVPGELLARLKVAERILGLREELLALEGLLPVCSYCRRLRDADGSWMLLEQYVEARSAAQFSHGICPDCYEKHMKPRLGG